MRHLAAVFALSLALPLVAEAQASIDTNSLRLRGARSTGGMLLPSADVLGAGAWDLSLTYGHEGEVVQSRLPTATTRGSDRFRDVGWIENRDIALLHFAMSPLERLELQAGLPFLLGQRVGSDPELAPIESGASAFGDLRLGLRYGVWEAGGMAASIRGGLFLPTGAGDLALGDEKARADVGASFGYRSEAGWAAHLHVGHLMGEPLRLGNQSFGDTFAGGLLLQYRHAVGEQALAWSLEAVASTVVSTVEGAQTARGEAVEILAGARYFFDAVYLDAGGGFAPIDDGLTPRWRLLASVGVQGLWEPAPPPEPRERIVYLPAPEAAPPPPPPPPSEPSEPAPDPREAFRTIAVEERSVYFEVDSAELDGAAHVVLRDVARTLLESERAVVITGYADDQGTPERNLALSRRRAEVVRDVLVQAGVEASRLEIEGAGDRTQMGQATPFGRSINRRVTFRWKE